MVSLLGAVALVACGPEPTTVSDAGAEDAASTGADAAAPGDAGQDTGPVDAGPLREDPTLPAATGACPDFHENGVVSVAPAGASARDATIWVSDAADTLDGPVVFFWHGAGGSPSEAPYVLGPEAMDAILALGGVVIAPRSDPAAGTFSWYLTTGSAETDLVVADELVACAQESVGIDARHVHSIGFSAGALHTAQMSYRRASYVASVVTYSGGLIARTAPATDAADARFAAMVLFGGPEDMVVINFSTASHNYTNAMAASGYFGFLCDHGMGHTGPTSARASAWRFLEDHPYGAHPDPYAGGLPDGFYAPCSLTAP
jgi:predicted esterase